MQSKAKTVEAYLADVPAERRAALTRLRDLCRELLPDLEETMAYGMPTYGRGADVVTAFASQKNYIAFYAGQVAIQHHAEALKGIDCGKGCIRYGRPEALDFAVARSILQDVAARHEAKR
jgi:uncharacterized protein YdhG (YjbR/CyaY superfamily)